MTDEDFITLKEYFNMRLKYIEEKISERLESQEKAVTVAYAASNKRLDGLNEIRQILEDQAKTFITKVEFETYQTMIRQDLARFSTEINSLNLSRAELSGKASQGQVILSMIIGITGLILGIVRMFMN